MSRGGNKCKGIEQTPPGLDGVALCEVCHQIIPVRGRQRRRWCGPFCRVKVGRGTISDHLIVLQYNREQRQVTAIHEAGHAVVGLSIGWSVESMDLDAGGQQLGQTTPDGHGGRSDDDLPADAAMVDLAGYVAEWIDGGRNGPEAIVALVLGPYQGDGDDYKARVRMWEATEYRHDPEEDRRFVESTVSRAEAILREHWSDVRRIAALLLARGHLTGSDLDYRAE